MENALFWAAQAVSVVATVCNVASFQCRSNARMLLWQGLVGGLLWTLHYALLGVWSSCLLCTMSILRAFFARRMYRRGTRDTGVLLLLLAGITVAGSVGAVMSWDGGGWMAWVPSWLGHTIHFLLIGANLAATLAMWSKNGRVIRIVQLSVISPIWLLNNLCAFSVFGVVTEIFNMVSVTVSMIRYRHEKLT